MPAESDTDYMLHLCQSSSIGVNPREQRVDCGVDDEGERAMRTLRDIRSDQNNV